MFILHIEWNILRWPYIYVCIILKYQKETETAFLKILVFKLQKLNLIFTWNDMKLRLWRIGCDGVVPVGCHLAHKNWPVVVHLWHHRQSTLYQEGTSGPGPGDVGSQTEVKILVQSRRSEFVENGNVRFDQLHCAFDGCSRILHNAGRHGQCRLRVLFIDSWKIFRRIKIIIMTWGIFENSPICWYFIKLLYLKVEKYFKLIDENV